MRYETLNVDYNQARSILSELLIIKHEVRGEHFCGDDEIETMLEDPWAHYMLVIDEMHAAYGDPGNKGKVISMSVDHVRKIVTVEYCDMRVKSMTE